MKKKKKAYNDKNLDSDKKKEKKKGMCETIRSSSMLLDLWNFVLRMFLLKQVSLLCTLKQKLKQSLRVIFLLFSLCSVF